MDIRETLKDKRRIVIKVGSSSLIHPDTRKEIEELLWMLKTEGEERTFCYLREEVKRRKREKDFY